VHRSYLDILNRIDQDPLWYDEYAVPRYDPFKPDMLGIYDKWVVLVEIECQSCGRAFKVAEGWNDFDRIAPYINRNEPVPEFDFIQVASHFHYGDPPAHGCVGDTMNCVDIRILEAWEKRREPRWDWYEVTELKGLDIRPNWAVADNA